MVREDGYTIGKIISSAFALNRAEPLSPTAHWNYLTTLMICLVITPAMMFYPQFFAWAGVDFTLVDLDLGLRLVGLVVMQITLMGFTLSRHNHEYVAMGTMIHRPVELAVLTVIFCMGEIHWQFFVFMVLGVPVPAGVCFWLWKKETQVTGAREYWQQLANPGKDRSLLGRWIEKLGWIVLGLGVAVLVHPGWFLEALDISQALLVTGYIRVAGWAWMIVGWCYFMNARHENSFFFDLVLVQNALGIGTALVLWSFSWFPLPLLVFIVLKNVLITLSCVVAANIQSSKT